MTNQFGLFEGPEHVKMKDASFDEQKAYLRSLTPEPRPLREIHLRILRGFLSLHSGEDPHELLHRKLECLGGQTLFEMMEKDWKMVTAWTQEYQLWPAERERLCRAIIEPKKGKKK